MFFLTGLILCFLIAEFYNIWKKTKNTQPETITVALSAHNEMLQEIANLKAKVVELENAEPIKKIDNKFNKQEKTERVGISRYTQYLK